MRILLAILVVLAAHFSLTANVPAQAGKSWEVFHSRPSHKGIANPFHPAYHVIFGNRLL